MAIVVEGKKQNNFQALLYIIAWLILIIIILFGFYYIFFAKPEFYEKITQSSEPQNINEIINLSSNIDLDSLIQSNTFQSLKSYVDIPQDIKSGKENPFQ